ncbi:MULTISPECIES: phosphate signaling complex protein PhoU [unclassified Methanoregula]|uniref:phosphate signaling complex protein PhoU n=1 Tax=unclassified Methanoregula TaxID=2649730 RepID=UPI0009C54A27|nr:MULTISPECIES: phosphate signaling complex protein PhoU [unclassified Methanoregula]OPX63632.1 MAG: transcriptional regulator PhoU [Methanoregula sp. PtaB.Bin085]OPY36202.1 MAG: transcriptional regulator PhoU [Methanoregula sp. PtaU1.Bin006]
MAEKFHAELDTLKKDTVKMARFGRSMLRDAVDAMVRQDTQLAESVVARKEKIHELEVELEERCYQLIALYQPMAKDMREIACTLKVITASLRIGRYGKVIAKIVNEISDAGNGPAIRSIPRTSPMMSIPHMADLAIDMIDDAIEAYDTSTLRLIEDFSSRDDTIDALRHSIFREGITHMMENPRSLTRCTHFIMVARYLERCADHACNIAENVHYMETGERIEIH